MSEKNSAVQDMNNIINNAKLEAVAVEDHHPVMVVHENMNLEGLEEHAEKPYRIRATETFNTEKALSAYIKDFKNDTTRVFADLRQQTLSAVFDYHKPNGEAGWRDHKASLNLLADPDYEALKRAHGNWMSQTGFINAMTDLASFITQIDGKPATKADFLELVRDLKGMTAEAVEGKVGNSSVTGATSYSSKVTSGKTGAELPEMLVMRLPVFLGEDAVDHAFRIEPNTTEGLKLRLTLIRPEKVREEAFRTIVQRVAENGGVAVYGL